MSAAPTRKWGLYLIDNTVADQRKAGGEKVEQFNASHDGLAMDCFDPASYILIDAIRLELGLAPLDCRTSTRFVGMTEKSAAVDVCVPRASWYDGWLHFSRSGVGDYWDGSACRFSVGEEEEAQTFWSFPFPYNGAWLDGQDNRQAVPLFYFLFLFLIFIKPLACAVVFC